MNPAFLVIDKPPGVTSHDVVAMVRAVTGVQKVGHTGTLDPFATGVLALALGPATRLIQYLDEDLKVYDATVALGDATDTGDPTGEVIRSAPVPALDRAKVEAVLASFHGICMQAPPRYSAVKVRGRPLYSYARKGQDVTAEARPTRIDQIDLLALGPDTLRINIRCGKGTYARVLADEIATALGTAGHLSALRRSLSGPFLESRALTIQGLSKIVADREDWEAVLRPQRGPERVAWAPRDQVREALKPWLIRPLDVLGHLPLAPIRDGDRKRVLSGGHPPPPPLGAKPGELYLAVDGDEVVAVVRNEPRGPRLERVLQAD